MENKKTKNHKENWIGNIIRGFLLFMPLLAICIPCLYAIFNKNAYQSYYGETINDVQITFDTDLKEGTEYYFNIPSTPLNQHNNTGGSVSTYIEIDDLNIIKNTSDIDISTTKYIGFYSAPNVLNYGIYFYDNLNNNPLLNVSNTTTNYDIELSFILITQSQRFKEYYQGNNVIFYTKTYNNFSFVSEVFYYSIERVQESPLFNWAKNTGLYNVIHGACTTLEIQTTFVPFLLSYWLLTYLIYIIYDIALLIVNMAHNRIHDVESSI